MLQAETSWWRKRRRDEVEDEEDVRRGEGRGRDVSEDGRTDSVEDAQGRERDLRGTESRERAASRRVEGLKGIDKGGGDGAGGTGRTGGAGRWNAGTGHRDGEIFDSSEGARSGGRGIGRLWRVGRYWRAAVEGGIERVAPRKMCPPKDDDEEGERRNR